MKGQSLIFQFILFLTIAFFIFIGFGNVFSIYSTNFEKQSFDSRLQNSVEFISSLATQFVESANSADYIEYRLRFSNVSKQREIEIYMDNNGIRGNFIPLQKIVTSYMNNLNYSVSQIVGYIYFGYSYGILKYNQTSNKLELIGIG